VANNGRPEIEYLSVQIIAVFQVRLLVTKVLVAAKLPILGIWVLVVVANAEMVFDVQLNMAAATTRASVWSGVGSRRLFQPLVLRFESMFAEQGEVYH
jgi:hypothetical protein